MADPKERFGRAGSAALSGQRRLSCGLVKTNKTGSHKEAGSHASQGSYCLKVTARETAPLGIASDRLPRVFASRESARSLLQPQSKHVLLV